MITTALAIVQSILRSQSPCEEDHWLSITIVIIRGSCEKCCFAHQAVCCSSRQSNKPANVGI